MTDVYVPPDTRGIVGQYSDFPDYPKMSLWPDGYYITLNLFNAAETAFLGAQDGALNRTQMVTVAPTAQPPAGSHRFVFFHVMVALGQMLQSRLRIFGKINRTS